MSGKIKTGDSTWSSASDIYVKTGTGSWNRARTAYVKTGASTWSLWFRAAITDTFGRTTSGSLGTADTGQTWTINSGSWYVNGSQAQTDTAASSYPLASINFGTETATVSASVSSGTGPAVWVQDANNWYAAVINQTQVNGTYPCNCSCNGHYDTYNIPCTGYGCPPCGTGTSTTTESYIGTATTVGTGTYGYCGSAQLHYNCPNGGTLSGTRCYTCGTFPYYNYSNGRCYSVIDPYLYTSASSYGATSSYDCVGTGCETNTCPGCSYYSCYNQRTTTVYVCSNYLLNGVVYTDSGGGSSPWCYHTTTTTTCNSPCNIGGSCGTGSTFVSGGTYPNCDGYGSSCGTCGTLVNAYAIRLLSSVNGVVTQVGTDISLPSAAAAIKISTEGSTITYQAYSDTALTSPIGTQGVANITSPITAQSYGILKAPSSYGQGSTIDDFKISG